MTVLALLFKNKYAQIGVVVLLLIGAFALFVSNERKQAITNYINSELQLVINNLRGDQNAVDEADNNLGSGSILDRLFPDTDSEDRQERSEGDIHEAPNTYPREPNGGWFTTNRRGRAEKELPYIGVDKQPEATATYPTILPPVINCYYVWDDSGESLQEICEEL